MFLVTQESFSILRILQGCIFLRMFESNRKIGHHPFDIFPKILFISHFIDNPLITNQTYCKKGIFKRGGIIFEENIHPEIIHLHFLYVNYIVEKLSMRVNGNINKLGVKKDGKEDKFVFNQ